MYAIDLIVIYATYNITVFTNYLIFLKHTLVFLLQFEWGGMVACQVNGAWKLRGVIARDNCFFQSGPIIVSSVDYQKSWLDLCLANYVTCPALV